MAVLLAVAPGCDLVRASLGKPTSAELTAIRLAKEAREQAIRDSIAQAAEQARLEAEQAAAAAAQAESLRSKDRVHGRLTAALFTCAQ